MPKKTAAAGELVSLELIDRRIYLLRGHRVMLDADLAALYGVPTKAVNRAVKRNPARFPEDFMFQLTAGEVKNLRLQTGASSWGGRRYLPYAFTQEGIAMLSSVLRGERAIQVNIVIMRAFVRFRRMLATHKDLARKLKELERKYSGHDEQIQAIFEALQELIEPPARPRRRIGFVSGE